MLTFFNIRYDGLGSSVGCAGVAKDIFQLLVFLEKFLLAFRAVEQRLQLVADVVGGHVVLYLSAYQRV